MRARATMRVHKPAGWAVGSAYSGVTAKQNPKLAVQNVRCEQRQLATESVCIFKDRVERGSPCVCVFERDMTLKTDKRLQNEHTFTPSDYRLEDRWKKSNQNSIAEKSI